MTATPRSPFDRLGPLPALGFGAAAIGNLYTPVDEDASIELVRSAYRSGVRLFDTAPLYGYGLSERRLGLGLRGLPRDDIVLCSKVGRLLEPGADGDTLFAEMESLHPVFDFSADGVRRSLEASLERLGVDRLDVVHVHDPDEHEEEALSGAFPALLRLRDEGVIGAVGAGMNQTAMLSRFVRRLDIDCVLVAGRYTLLDPSAGEELFPACLDRGVRVVVGGVLNSGVLADPHPGATFEYAPVGRGLLERAGRIQEECSRWGLSLPEAAVGFTASHPAVSVVLIGMRSQAELDEANRAISLHPDPSLWRTLVDQGLMSRGALTGRAR